MELNNITNRAETYFDQKADKLKQAYSEEAIAVVFVKHGKDDEKGRCYMVNLIVGSNYWNSFNGVKMSLWQEDEEYQYKDQLVEFLLELAKNNGFDNISVQDETEF
jgi:hypothetical protein